MNYSFEKLNGFTPYQPPREQNGIIANANESFLEPSVQISREIGMRAAELASNRYPDPYARSVREGFGKFYGIDADLVTVGNGSDELLSVLICGFLQKGDRFVTLTPDFSMYPFYAKLSGAEHVALEKATDLMFEPEQVIARVQELKPKMLMFSNPCNPSSVGLRREAVLKIVRECGCIVVVDEAYMDFWEESLLSEVSRYENLIVLRTLSKVGYAAYRLGFAAACPALTDLIRAVKSPYNVNALSQAAGEVVFAHPEDLRSRIAAICSSRDALYADVCELAQEFPGCFRVPESRTNFVTLLTEEPRALWEFLAQEKIFVSLNSGRYVRITCCAPADNVRIVQALRRYFNQ